MVIHDDVEARFREGLRVVVEVHLLDAGGAVRHHDGGRWRCGGLRRVEPATEGGAPLARELDVLTGHHFSYYSAETNGELWLSLVHWSSASDHGGGGYSPSMVQCSRADIWMNNSNSYPRSAMYGFSASWAMLMNVSLRVCRSIPRRSATS